MSVDLGHLKTADLEQLYDAFPLITLLIAGADGDISDEEVAWAKKIIHIRSYKMKADLRVFYEEVDNRFETRFNHYRNLMPAGVYERTEAISERLKELNLILSRLNPETGAKIYKGFVSFAEQVAKSEGGVMGFFTISKEEAALVGLPMIDPIFHASEEEE